MTGSGTPAAPHRVVASAPRYRAAAAELPLSVRLVDEAAHSIVVVAGAGRWTDGARDAAHAGAAAVIVADPGFVGAAAIAELARAVDIPVIIERPLLRPDLTALAARERDGAAPSALTADGGAPVALLHATVRDAVGWLRVLAAGPLEVVTGAGELALLQTHEGIAAAVSIVGIPRAPGAWMRVLALGETVTEIDPTALPARVTTSTVAGARVAPIRYESSERLALRRAVDALASGTDPDDLTVLTADTGLAELLLPAGR